MVIPITQDEFQALGHVWHRGATPGEEIIAVRNLTPLTGFRTPCRWSHITRCHGVTMLGAAGRKAGYKVACRCKDGTLYVFRFE